MCVAHKYVQVCTHMLMWGSQEDSSSFPPLSLNLDWLAGKLLGPACLCPTVLGFQAHTPTPGFSVGVKGFKHGLLCLHKKQSYSLSHLPTLHSSFKYS